MGDLSRIRVTGPLEPYVSGFVAELVERGYTPVSAAHQLRLMAHVSRWLASEGLGPDDLSPARVEEFVAARRAAGYVNYVTPEGAGGAVGASAGVGGRAAGRRAGAARRWRSCSAAIASGCAPSAGWRLSPRATTPTWFARSSPRDRTWLASLICAGSPLGMCSRSCWPSARIAGPGRRSCWSRRCARCWATSTWKV